MKDVDDLLKRRPQEDSKMESVDRQLKRLEKNMRAMEKDFTTQWTSWQRELGTTLQSKVSLDDVATRVDTKVSAIQDRFASTSELNQVRSLVEELQESQAVISEDVEQFHRAMQRSGGNAETEQMKSHIHELLSIVEKMQNEQSALKSLAMNHTTQSDPETDTKQAVLRLHEAVKSVRRSVETVAKRAEMEALSEQVAVIRKQLRSEIYQARYIWKEGRPTAKQTIPWSSQAVNSNADVFVWQHSQPDAVTTMIPGLYHLQAAFFTRFSPTLQVLVNGEPALILTSTEETDPKAGNNQEDASFTNQTHSSTRELGIRRRRLHHSAGDLVGVEITAFLALPARAAITITYDVDERAQGFLNLRKL